MYEKKSKYENNSQEICQLMVIQTGSPRPTQSSRPSVSFLHPVITTKRTFPPPCHHDQAKRVERSLESPKEIFWLRKAEKP